LEFDWSDKVEADELDTKCAILRNEHTNKQFYPGAARFQEMYAFLADRTAAACSAISYSRLSLFVCLSVTKCIVAKTIGYNLLQSV